MKFALSIDQLATAIGAYLTKHGFLIEGQNEGEHEVEVRGPSGFFTLAFSYQVRKEPVAVGLEGPTENSLGGGKEKTT